MGQPGGDQRRPGEGRGGPIVLAPCLLISAWLDYTRLKTSYDIANKGPGKGEEVSYPCFHMSEICIARSENILWHCQQACDQQGWERKPYCDSCRGTQASLPPPLTVTLTLLTPNKIYWKKYFSLIKPLRFNSSLLDDIWESQWKRTYTISNWNFFCYSVNKICSSSLKAFSVKTRINFAPDEWNVAWCNAVT